MRLPCSKWPQKYGVSLPNYPKGFIPQFTWPFKRTAQGE